MKIIVAGGRYFKGTAIHEQWLITQLKKYNVTELVCGMARGADMFGYNIAKYILKVPIKEFPAMWTLYGKSAGPKRNEEMADYADACILFPGGAGTASMKQIALEKGLFIIEYPA